MFRLLYALFSEKRRKSRQKQLKTTGISIQATITGFQQEPLHRYGSSSGFNEVVFRIAADSEINGETFSFLSERLYKHKLDDFKKGDKIDVLILHDDPSTYYFDPETDH